MTTPGQPLPDGAIGSDISPLNNLTEANWRATQLGKVGGFNESHTNFGSIFSGLLGSIVTGIGNFISDFLGALFGGYSGSDPKVVEIQTYFENQGTIISDKAYYAEIPASAPLWQSANPLEDCTFPRIFINRFAKPEDRRQGHLEYTAGVPTKPEGMYPRLNTSNFFNYPPGIARFGLIRSDRSRTYSTVSVMLGPRLSANPIRVGVYRMDWDTGDFVAHWRSADITPTVSQLKAEIRLEFPPVITQKADLWAVAILQTGTSTESTVRTVAGIITEYVEAPPLVYPPRQHARILSASTLPATATRSALDFTGDEYGTQDLEAEMLIWASLGENPAPEDMAMARYADTFGSRLSGSWAPIGPKFDMPGQFVAHNTTSDGLAGALWVTPTATDDVVLEGRQPTKNYNYLFTTAQGLPTARWQRLLARCSPDFRIGAACEWTSGTVRIITWNTDYPNSGNSYQLVATVSRAVAGGDTIRFAIKGNQATVWANGTQVLTTPITTSIGARYRHVGFGTSRSSFTSSGGLAAWSAADIEEEQ